MAVRKKGYRLLKRTPEVLDYIRKNSMKRTDYSIALGLRKLTGEKQWSKMRVFHIRRGMGIYKGGGFKTKARLPIGTVKVHRRSNYQPSLRIKVGERKWKRYAQYIWEQANGPMPKGHRVMHLDNDQMNCDLSNLKLMTAKEGLAYAAKFRNYNSWEYRERMSAAKLASFAEKRRKDAAQKYLSHTPYEFAR